MLTIEALAFLRTAAGERLLAEAAEVSAATPDLLRALTRLRRRHTPEYASAALETVRLRQKAAAKFPLAERMFFTAAALEQATSAAVAAHTAARYAGYEHVLDLCCGIGADTLALAAVARVTAVDRDPLRLAIARANAEVCGMAGRITFRNADVTAVTLPAAEAAFCDPGRRGDAGRIFDVRRYEPPLAAVLRLAEDIPARGIKVAPGIRDADVPPGCEAEFVQEGRDLKQATLWFGPLATATRRATLLPGPLSLAEASVPRLDVRAPRGVLYEPAPAVIRAHLIQQLGQMLNATRLDETTAFLSGDTLSCTPYATAFLIDECLRFNLKALQRRLRSLDVGRVVVKTRASPLDPQALEQLLKLEGSGERVLVLTRVLGRHSVLICRRAPEPDAETLTR